MARITLQGKPFNTIGELPKTGGQAPDFSVTKTDLSDVSLKDFAHKKIILNIFPSIDTPTCAMSVRHFNESASKLDNAVVLCISADLPFAQKRFCAAEGLQNVIPASVFRHSDFGKKYGVAVTDGPLAGLLARAVVLIDEQGKIKYTQLVDEVAKEPDYEAALAAFLSTSS